MDRMAAYMMSNKVTAADGSTQLQQECMVTHAQWEIAAVYNCRRFHQNWKRYDHTQLQGTVLNSLLWSIIATVLLLLDNHLHYHFDNAIC